MRDSHTCRSGRSGMLVRAAAAADLAGALAVWQRANTARGRPPDGPRVERVRTKLADADALVLVAVDDDAVVGDDDAVVGDDDAVVGMVLAEPGRYDNGAG